MNGQRKWKGSRGIVRGKDDKCNKFLLPPTRVVYDPDFLDDPSTRGGSKGEVINFTRERGSKNDFSGVKLMKWKGKAIKER